MCHSLPKILNGDYGTYSITDDYRDIYSINNVECPEVVMALAMEVGQVNTGWMRNMPFMPYNCWDYFGGTYSQSGWNCVCLAPSWDNSEMYSRMVVLTILRAFLPTTVIS